MFDRGDISLECLIEEISALNVSTEPLKIMAVAVC
jgi:hypothetical protein